MSSNKEITSILSGPVVTNKIISILEEQDLPYRVSTIICNNFSEYDFKAIVRNDLDTGLVEVFKQFFDVPFNDTDSKKHREYILKFKEFIPILETEINRILIKWFSNIYTQYLPIPACSIYYKCSKHTVELIKCRLYYKTRTTGFVTTQDSYSIAFCDDTWEYNYTNLLNIILTSYDTRKLTPRGIKEYRNSR